jgi:hypothetical protein
MSGGESGPSTERRVVNYATRPGRTGALAGARAPGAGAGVRACPVQSTAPGRLGRRAVRNEGRGDQLDGLYMRSSVRSLIEVGAGWLRRMYQRINAPGMSVRRPRSKASSDSRATCSAEIFPGTGGM